MRAIRKQGDDLGDTYSALTSITEMGQDMARQEFKNEADVNVILSRFGAFAPQRFVEYGRAVDYGLDLQTALEAVAAARRAHGQLDQELRDKFPTWQSLLNALDSGEFKLEANKPPAAEPVVETLPEGSEST